MEQNTNQTYSEVLKELEVLLLEDCEDTLDQNIELDRLMDMLEEIEFAVLQENAQ